MHAFNLNLLLFLALLLPTAALGTNYYVDANLGDDSNTGLSPADAWQNLSKANAFAFQPGDSILFKKSCAWNGMLSIEYSGTSTSPITYGAYGAGAKPLIHGQGIVEAAIFIRNSTSYITIDGFAVTNYDGLDVYDGAEGIRSGIHTGEWSHQQFDIKILNNEVYFVEGCSNHTDVGSPRGTSLDPNDYNQYQNAGIFCHASKITGLLIQGNYVHDCSSTGINAFLFEEANDLLIRQNSVYNLGSDGIVILNGKSPVVELNSCIDAGNNSGTSPQGAGVIGFNGLAVAGIWSHCSDSPLFQYNYCEGTKRIVWDGQPWDFDILTTGDAIYQYNFSRDNEGGFNLGGLPHQLYRYNISYNDGSEQGGGQFFFNGEPTFYNNIFYRDDGEGFMMSDIEAQDFKNNIFHTNATTNITYEGDARVFENNCFYGHTPTNPGSDALLSDPIFINEVIPGKILPGVIFSKEDLFKIAFGYQVHSSSPCVDAGQNLTGNGAQDYWENSLYNNSADIGSNEYYPEPILATFCQAAQAPEQDGIGGLYWQGITSHDLSKQVIGAADNADDLQASFQASWDATNLYLLIKIQDDNLINDSAAEPWNDDAIELFIDGNNDKSLSYDANDYQFILRYNDPNIYEFQSGILQNTNPAGIQKVQRLTHNGYQIELSISWSAFGLSANTNQQIGFDLHVNDDDDGSARDSKIAWKALVDLSASIPFTFGTIQLGPSNCATSSCSSLPTNTWQGPSIGFWNDDPAHWSAAKIPAPCDSVFIPSGVQLLVRTGYFGECGSLELGTGSELKAETGAGLRVGE